MSCYVLGEFSSILSILDAAKIVEKTVFRGPVKDTVLFGLPPAVTVIWRVHFGGASGLEKWLSLGRCCKNEEKRQKRRKSGFVLYFLPYFSFKGRIFLLFGVTAVFI